MEVVDQGAADLADPDDAHVAALERRAAPQPLGHRPHRPEHAEGGGGRRVAGAALASLTPVTWGVTVRMRSMSAWVVPTSSAVT